MNESLRIFCASASKVIALICCCITSMYWGAAMSASQDVWGVIDSLLRASPYTPEKMGSLVGTKMELNASEQTLREYLGGNVTLAGGTQISSSELRFGLNNKSDPGFVILRLSRPCISLADVRKRYPALEETDIPRGRSIHEVTAFSTYGTWGELTFMFPVTDPDCVRSISIAPTVAKR